MFRGLPRSCARWSTPARSRLPCATGACCCAANDILFDSGKVELKDEARRHRECGQGAGRMADRHFLVAGHTDNVPSRPTSSVPTGNSPPARGRGHPFDGRGGMKPSQLGAAGYADFDRRLPMTRLMVRSRIAASRSWSSRICLSCPAGRSGWRGWQVVPLGARPAQPTMSRLGARVPFV